MVPQSLFEKPKLYKGQAKTLLPPERPLVYREIFCSELGPDIMNQIHKATNGNFAVGSSRFKVEVSKMLGCRVTPRKAERPKKLSVNCGLSPIVPPGIP